MYTPIAFYVWFGVCFAVCMCVECRVRSACCCEYGARRDCCVFLGTLICFPCSVWCVVFAMLRVVCGLACVVRCTLWYGLCCALCEAWLFDMSCLYRRLYVDGFVCECVVCLMCCVVCGTWCGL